jgi:hypothetical protein
MNTTAQVNDQHQQGRDLNNFMLHKNLKLIKLPGLVPADVKVNSRSQKTV